jgi:hypothetical protein
MVHGTGLKMTAWVLHAASIAAVLFILAGLVGFLTDEVRGSSTVVATRIGGLYGKGVHINRVDITQPNPPPLVERLRERRHTSTREVIDEVGDVLMSPFTWIADRSRAWVRRLAYSGLALLIYGFLGSLLADKVRRLADKRRRGAIVAADEAAAAKRRESGTFLSPA